MRGLERFEMFAERLLEGSLARLMGGRLEPVELAKRLARVMDDNQTVGAGKVFVPNRYDVYLNPANFAEFQSFQGALEAELANYLTETAERRQFSIVDRPRVTLHAEPGVRPGDTRIEAKLMDAQGIELSGPGMTQELEIAQGRSPADTHPSVPVAPVAWLIDEVREIPLRTPRLTIGRALDNDLIMEHAGVSRHHAEIELRHNRYILRDLGSRHGTQVNGQTVRESVLRDGDVITMGGQRLVFRANPAPGEPPAPQPGAPAARPRRGG